MCVEFVLCIAGFLTLWSQGGWAPFCLFLLFQEQLEMHWMLGSPIRKMLRPCDYWSQVRMIKEQLSTTSIQCCLGNKYPLNAFFSCKGPNVSFLFRLHHGMNLLIHSCSTCLISQSIQTMMSYY